MNIADKKRERFWILESRLNKLRQKYFGFIEYDKQTGMAARYYPNPDSSRTKIILDKIAEERNGILHWLRTYNFDLKYGSRGLGVYLKQNYRMSFRL